MNQNKLKNKM